MRRKTFRKLVSMMLAGVMVLSSAAFVMAEEETTEAEIETEAEEDEDELSEAIAQFEGLKADEAYDFPIIVKSFQSTYWQAALKGMDMAKEELGITYKAQGPNSESDIADQVNMLDSAINNGPVGIGLAACDTTSVLESLQNCVYRRCGCSRRLHRLHGCH